MKVGDTIYYTLPISTKKYAGKIIRITPQGILVQSGKFKRHIPKSFIVNKDTPRPKPVPTKKTPKFVILTYKGNLPFAEETKQVLKKDWNINADIVLGYQIGDKYTKYNVIAHGIKDKIVDKYDEDIYYLEDDVRFTSNPLDIPKKDIVWSVYRRGKLTNKPPHNVITGSQAIFFSKKALSELRTFMNTRKFKQIDGYLSEFVRKHPQLSFQQMIPKMGYEEDHVSLISKAKDMVKYTKPN